MNRWRNVDLELESAVVDAIERESSTDEEGKRRKLLERWKEIYGHEATFERLVSSLIASGRADLAGGACEACKKVVPCAKGQPRSAPLRVRDKGTSVQPDAPCKPFTTDAQSGQAVVGEQLIVDHDGPVKHPVETVGTRTAVQVSGTSKQEESQSHESSDMVASGPVIAPSPPSHSHKLLDKVLDLFKREKDEKSGMAANLEKKKEKMKVLKERKDKVEGYLSDKEKKIERLESEAKQMQLELDEERMKRKNLDKKEKRLKRLEDDVFQKETQLRQEKEEKHEKCERVTELEEQLRQAHAELEKEKDAKEDTKRELAQASERVRALQKDVKKASSEVGITEEEKKKIECVLEWMRRDLEEGKEEVEQLNCMLARQKEVMITYCSIMILLLAILAGLVLYNIGILQ
jgi:hypothetical protein